MSSRSLKKAKLEVADFFENHDIKIFSPSQIRQILDFHRDEWGIETSTFSEFSEFLVEEIGLLPEICIFQSRTYTRYTVGKIPLHEFLLSLIPHSYLSHHTALFLHGLIEKKPYRIYLNFPQARKSRKSSSLDQNSIDQAFQRSVRISKNSAVFRGNQVLLLNSMGYNDLGIIKIDGPEGTKVRITDIERTLLDITVRPVYCGGVSNVLSAYRKAMGKVSIRKLTETLKALDFAYPYHQSIGFCLEKSGYASSELALLLEFPIKYNFYLDYQMPESDYWSSWRLYFPKGLL